MTVVDTEKRLRGLLLKGLAGDAKGYHEFLQALSAHVRAFLRGRLTGYPDEVEDMVQETLLAVHNQRHTYDAAQPLTAWVHAIARYKMVDMLRRRGAREALQEPLDEETAVFAAADIEAGDARRDVTRLLDELPEAQRQAIVYMKLEGRSVIETAKLTGMSESSVKVSVHRGLKKLEGLIRSAS